MADKLKEFVNQTFTHADLSVDKKIPLFTTDATHQAVIKDVLVSRATVQGELTINGFAVGDISSMSGTEIVDINSTVEYKVTSEFNLGNDALFEFTYLSSDTTLNAYNFNASEVPLAISAQYEHLSKITSITSSSVNNFSFSAIADDGNLFFGTDDGNSSQIIYKATTLGGGWTNISTTALVDSSNTPFVFDGVDKLYSIDGETFYKFDINTEVRSIIGTTGIGVGGSSYPFIALANNFLFAASNAYGTQCCYMNVLNPTQKGVFTIPFEPAVGHYPNMFYDFETDTYYYTFFSASKLQVYKSKSSANLETNATNMVFTFAYELSSAIASDTLPRSKPVFSGKNGYLIFRASSAEFVLVNYRTGAYEKINSVTSTTSKLSLRKKTIATQMSDYDIDVTARITGVETTL